MFKRVLIANRGEIAVRIIRACEELDIETVAIFSEADENALHVQLADHAVCVGGADATDSYLNKDSILRAALETGADAIHPGYGFLAENAEFAQAVIDAGITWIGPPPQAIADLGDKVTARHIAERANAPMAPGTKDPVADAGEVKAFAEEHGLPIAIKAAFGGGGRGMKVAYEMDEVEELF